MKIIEPQNERPNELPLTPNELYLVNMFRQLNDRAQGLVVRSVVSALRSPLLKREPPKPVLRLVAGKTS